MFSFKEAGYCATRTLGRQVPDGRVASIDYTQVRENAASDIGATASANYQTTILRRNLQPFATDCYTNISDAFRSRSWAGRV